MMKRPALRQLLTLITCVIASTAHASSDMTKTIQHVLNISLEPATSMITAQDTITLPDHLASQAYFEFLLHAGLKPTSSTHAVETLATPSNSIQHHYRVKLSADKQPITLNYSGVINHPISADGEQYARGFKETPGLIDKEGIFLAGSTLWYPVVSEQLVSFKLAISLPEGWSAISQGSRIPLLTEALPGWTKVMWEEKQPQDDIFIIANRYYEYRQSAGATEAMVFLRDADETLAQKYLDTTAQYLSMYNKLLGPYPYQKFAMVENFWDTGYGMPSFTLLGPRVIRFPFILHSSYPHEILHNWWGNGVFVDYDKGNWAEGLTTYLADHLIAEQRGRAINYRRDVLQRYSDFVIHERDFPLSEFRSRHSAATEAVGYGKTLMLFHMLRQQLGNRDFVRALATLYRKHRFTIASFQDVEAIFSQVSEQNLAPFFEQWVQRAGAPSLKLDNATTRKEGRHYRLNASLIQQQTGIPFKLKIPVMIYLEGQSEPHIEMVTMASSQVDLSLTFEARPLRIEIDPMFDLFRRLDDKEIPSALSQGFGAERVLMLLPSKAHNKLLSEYRNMAMAWAGNQPGDWQVKLDSEIDQLPSDQAVWILGWNNLFSDTVKQALKKQGVSVDGTTLTLKEQSLPIANHSVMLTARHPDNSGSTLVWLATSRAEAVPALARKLPHYRKYSYLAFEGDEGNNVAKGQWRVLNSPMSLDFNYTDNPERDGFKLTPAPALAQLPPVFSEKRMMADVTFLASKEIQGRGLGTPELDKAADYIANEFKKMGLQPGGDNNSFFQRWSEDVGTPLGHIQLTNVIAVLPGNNPQLAGESLVISAHYDHLGLGWPDVHKGDEGKPHVGADDNASGVAVMLELARQVSKKWKPGRSIVFVAFTAEEAGLRGSYHYTHAVSALPARKAIAILNLDTVGRVGAGPVTIFGTQTARELVHVIRGAGFVTGIQTQSITPNNKSGELGFSDQQSFYDIGVPGVQFFGSVHSDFHRPTDTIELIDSAGMVKVAAILKETAEYLANTPDGLTINLPRAAPQKRSQRARQGRRVTVGTIPDFAFSGNGVRISGTTPDSPAAQAGLKNGDILTTINGKTISDLAAYAKVLRALKAGETITLQYQRSGSLHQVEITTIAR
ncbi:MAG: M20/M25/M40 family metallo-hydrolase [Gammaproteobacteria bacterium]|nr:M20/M25/M40 family metallo-hydrolase [Gammaproteobacteria bacterium]